MEVTKGRQKTFQTANDTGGWNQEERAWSLTDGHCGSKSGVAGQSLLKKWISHQL